MPDRNTVCILTPPGRGALAVVQVAGPAAAKTLATCLRDAANQPLSWLATASENQPATPPRPRYARWPHPAGSEDVVVVQRGAAQFELCTHGGVWAAESVCEQLVGCGFHRVSWDAFREAQDPNRWRVAANRAVLDARTARAADWLLRNADELPAWVAELASRLQRGETAGVLGDLAACRTRHRWGTWLRQGWQLVIAGHPNVGKSTLFNRILGFERTIVVDQPGSTRDLVNEPTVVAGWPIWLADTAGLRETGDLIEQQGVVRAERAIEQADLVILVCDRSQAWDPAAQYWLALQPPPLLVHAKSDLPPAGQRPAGIEVSAEDSTAVGRVLAAVAERLFGGLATFAPFPTDAWQIELLAEVESLVRNGRGLAALGLLRKSLGMP